MTAGFVIGAEELKKGEMLFRLEPAFVAGADNPGIIPEENLPEVAFAGRSNVGKSSLINAITGRRGLARASNTPGRTQQINFFNVGDALCLVDLPGYGYAAASKTRVHSWNEMVKEYLCTRRALKRVFVLIDARHGLKDSDRETFRMLGDARVPCIAVLTKADKVKTAELEDVMKRTAEELAGFSSAFPVPYATSADKKTGIAELRAILAII